MVSKKIVGQAIESPLALGDDRGSPPIGAPNSHMPSARECALLLLRLIEAKETELGRQLSRFKIADLSLQRMWGRHRIPPQFLEEVSEWLLRAGRVIFFVGSSYGVVLVSVVEGWSRLSSNRISSEIEQVLAGVYPFSKVERLFKISGAEKEGESASGDSGRKPIGDEGENLDRKGDAKPARRGRPRGTWTR